MRFKIAGLNFLVLFVLVFVPSCVNEEVCEDVATVPVRIGFYTINPVTGNATQTTLDSITVFGVGNDSVIYNNRFNVGQIELPLNSRSDSTGFVFRLPGNNLAAQNVFDTIWFHYDRVPVLISMDCGFVSFYDLLRIEYTSNRIDSLFVKNTDIINTIDEHIEIFPVR